MDRIIGSVARDKVRSVEQSRVLARVLVERSIEDGRGTTVAVGKSSRFKVRDGVVTEVL